MTVTRAPAGGRAQRPEAPLKLTGAARYAADHRPDGVLHAVLVGAPVAAGRLRGVDAAAARVRIGRRLSNTLCACSPRTASASRRGGSFA